MTQPPIALLSAHTIATLTRRFALKMTRMAVPRDITVHPCIIILRLGWNALQCVGQSLAKRTRSGAVEGMILTDVKWKTHAWGRQMWLAVLGQSMTDEAVATMRSRNATKSMSNGVIWEKMKE